jgi:hypothetical protein
MFHVPCSIFHIIVDIACAFHVSCLHVPATTRGSSLSVKRDLLLSVKGDLLLSVKETYYHLSKETYCYLSKETYCYLSKETYFYRSYLCPRATTRGTHTHMLNGYLFHVPYSMCISYFIFRVHFILHIPCTFHNPYSIFHVNFIFHNFHLHIPLCIFILHIITPRGGTMPSRVVIRAGGSHPTKSAQRYSMYISFCIFHVHFILHINVYQQRRGSKCWMAWEALPTVYARCTYVV